MRAICRVPGERMFNTRGASGSPRVFTSAANTAVITRCTSRIILGLQYVRVVYVYVVSERKIEGRGRRHIGGGGGGGIREYVRS